MDGDPDAPPEYEDVQPPEEPPPSYDSLFGEVQAAKRQSTTHLEFLRKFVGILWGTVGCTFIVGMFIAVPVSMIIMGAIYLQDCPAQPYIPKFLIVAGCFGVLKNMLVLLGQTQCWKKLTDESQTLPRNRKKNSFKWLLNIFLVVWFLAGCVGLFQIYTTRSGDKTDDDYCNETLYQFALWITIIAMVGICGAGTVALGMSKS